MNKTTALVILLVLGIANALPAQRDDAVAEVLQLDVLVSYGAPPPPLPVLPPEARECELRDEPGLRLRLSRRPLRDGVTAGFYSSEGSLHLTWNEVQNRSPGAFKLGWQEFQHRSTMTYTQNWEGPEEFWRSGSALRIEHHPFWARPGARRGWARVLYLMVLPRSEEPGDIPEIPRDPTIDDLLRLAAAHHTQTGNSSSRDFIADLARFIPIDDQPRRSLEAFLNPKRLKDEIENLGHRGRRGVRIVRGGWNDNQEYRRHQALLRAGHEAPPPRRRNAFMGQEDYAVYRQLFDQGLVQARPGIELIELLLEVSSDTGAHGEFLAALESPDFGGDDERRRGLIVRLRRELASREPFGLTMLALGNLLGLGLLILAIRVFCRRLLFG